MKKATYALADIKIGNHVRFLRNGTDDFRMDWTVIGFYEGMVRVKIQEMGYNEEIGLFVVAGE